ncbi:MAG: hypothetical protein JW797_12295 [Bradymonadales bacterium]|nr:hypothetical protein [Bradymonadales bacterium]
MSDNHDMQTGEVSERLFFRWTSDEARATFRLELGETSTVEVSLKEVYAETPEGGGAPDLVRVTFEVSLEEYFRLEKLNWFGLKPGLAQGMGFQFHPDLPIRIVAHLDEDTLMAAMLIDFNPDKPGEAMEELIAPLFDPEAYGIESPLAYNYQRVLQQTDEGAVGFTAEGVKAHEAAEGEIMPPAEMFMAQEGATAEGSDMEGVEYFRTDEALESLTAELDSPVFFAGKRDVEGRLTEIQVLVGGQGAARLTLVVEFDHATYLQIEQDGIFELTQESKSRSTLGDFDPRLPVQLTLLLKADLLKEHFGQPDLDWEEALGELAGSLSEREGDDPLRQTDAYVYESVMQQPEGRSFHFGFNNQNLSR